MLSFLMTACAFVPTVKSPDSASQACNFYTPEWKLSVKELHEAQFCDGAGGNDLGACLLTVGLVIPVGSLLVSGSFVLVGNTIHWLEYHGTCEDGAIHQQLRAFKNSFGTLERGA